MLNDLVTEAIRENFARQWWYRHARRLALQNVSKVFKVAVTTPYGGGFELEGGDVCSTEDFVRCVHGAANAVSLGIAHLQWESAADVARLAMLRHKIGPFRQARDKCSCETHLNLEEVLGRTVDFFERLLT